MGRKHGGHALAHAKSRVIYSRMQILFLDMVLDHTVTLTAQHEVEKKMAEWSHA